MLHFRSLNDLNQLPTTDPAYKQIKTLLTRLLDAYTWQHHKYSPADHGWIVYLNQDRDFTEPLSEIWDDGTTFLDLDNYWENTHLEDGIWTCVLIVNDDAGFIFIAQDSAIKVPAIRNMLEQHLDPPKETAS